MAPRGPRSSNNGREARGHSLNAKASSRGGVLKRKGPSRVDGDGDLDMDAAAKRLNKAITGESSGPRSRPPSRSSAPHNPRNTRGVSRTAQAVLKNLRGGGASSLAARVSDSAAGRSDKGRGRGTGMTFLRVHGLKQSKAANNEDGGLNDLIGFLERKASTVSGKRAQVMIKKSHAVGDYVFIGASKQDAEEVMKLNTFTFAGAQLEIVESDEGLGYQSKATTSKETEELRAKLQSILSQRYQGASKLLKLDALASDPELVTLGVFENRERALKTFKGLMAICDGLFETATEKREAIESISLANNNIDDVSQVESVATTFPQLKNLDMSGNQIGSMQAMDRWRGKFQDLETIYMAGNPIEATDPNYRAALLDWFPKLQDINGAQVRTAEQVKQQASASRPKPIPQSGPDFRDVSGVGENFLLEFFAAFDHDRPGLASRFYDEGSQFSLAIDTRSFRDPNAPAPLPWSSYIKVSRNLVKINHQNARIQRLFRGANVILDLWQGLPLTQHPDIKQDLSKYIMDCHPLPGLADPNGQVRTGVDGLVISVHGEFEEYDAKAGTRGKRSFSRSFVLGPGQAGKGPIRVVSDMLSLRAYSPLPNIYAAAAGQDAGVNDRHGAMVAELSKQTGMVPEYSKMCLSQVDWQFDKAIVVFNEKKAALPAEAFASMAR